MAVDLLRPALQPSRRSTSVVMVVVLAADVAVSCMVGALLVAMGLQLAGVGPARARIDQEIAAIRPQWAAMSAQRAEIPRMRREIMAIRGLRAAPPWPEALEALRTVAPAGLWLARVTIDDTGSIDVAVRASQSKVIAEFVARLQSVQGIDGVRLVSTETVRVAGQEILQATIAARVSVQ
jgi:hypothetical protein